MIFSLIVNACVLIVTLPQPQMQGFAVFVVTRHICGYRNINMEKISLAVCSDKEACRKMSPRKS